MEKETKPKMELAFPFKPMAQMASPSMRKREKPLLYLLTKEKRKPRERMASYFSLVRKNRIKIKGKYRFPKSFLAFSKPKPPLETIRALALSFSFEQEKPIQALGV